MNSARTNQKQGPTGFGFGNLAARMRRLALPVILGGVVGTAGLGWVLAQDFGAPPRTTVMPTIMDTPSAPTKTIMRTNVINLPIDMPEQLRPQLQEVHIYVKEGNGPWVLKDRVAASQTFYTFRAPQDGEYSFKLATIDRAGRSNIADINRERPDTTILVATAQAAPGGALEVRHLGETSEGINIQVSLRNGNIETANPKLYYQTGNRLWQPLDPLPTRPDQFCIPAHAVLTGLIRVTGANLKAEEFHLSQLPPANSPPINQTTYNPGTYQPVNNSPPKTVLIDPQEKIELVPPGNPPGGTMKLPPQNSGIKIFPGGAGNDPPPQIKDMVEVVSQKPGGPMLIPNHQTGKPIPIDNIIYRPGQGSTPGQTVDLLPPPEKNAQPTLPARRDGAAPNRQLVNNPRVVLDYQLDQVGASGVGRVDIYITRDSGQNWQKIGEDADKKSPAEVNLPGDGLFGISLAVTNGRGFGGNPPQPGDQPDWWVEVDTTKPTAEITGIRTGNPGEDAGAIYISWTAKDKNISPEPIDLFHAPSREGPWLPIAKGLRNEGQYRWVPGRDVGSQAFIRLVAHDQAGNIARSETVQPVPLDDMSRPRARPVGLNPAVRTTSVPPLLENPN